MQTQRLYSRAGTHILMPLALACLGGVTLAAPTGVYAQDRSHDRRDDSHDRKDNSHDRKDDSKDRRDASHEEARRGRDESHVRFTHSADERRFDNGVTLRRGAPAADHRFDAYFPHHYYSYPHYAVARDAGRVVISPFSFYVGIFPPYIDRSAVIIGSPRHVFIDVPIYVHGEYRPYGEGRDDYYLNRRNDDNRWKDDPEVKRAVYDLEDAFRNEDIALLAPLTDPATNIAVFAKGRYQYALSPDDYLDMTRDFLRSAHTTGFTAYRVHPRSGGVYQVFARHTYQDQNGQTRTVYLCVVLERLSERWTITQIDTSPAHVD